MLELRYGLRGEKPRTLDELGRMFNVTRERIRQVESQSLQKLARSPTPGAWASHTGSAAGVPGRRAVPGRRGRLSSARGPRACGR